MHNIKDQIEALYQRIQVLHQAAEVVSGQSEAQRLLALEEQRAAALEELHVALEELHHQNRELVVAWEAVEEERRRYQGLFECAPDGYLVTDVHGIIREANRAAARLLNVPSLL
jgi:PAS domain-containing protein